MLGTGMRSGSLGRARMKVVGVAVAVALCATAAGCGDDGEEAASSAGGTDNQQATEIRVAHPPTVEAAPLFIAQSQGYFEEEDLEVEPVAAESAAAQLPALTSGDVKFSQSTPGTALTAAGQGLPIRVIVGGGRSGVGDEDISGIAVGPGSDIKTLKDLEGRTVSIIVFKSVAEYTTRDLLAREGVDVKQVKLVETPFAEIPAALKSGRIDASFVAEPFKTIAESQGATTIAPAFSNLTGGRSIETSNWITTAEYLENNPDVVERFVAAMYKANAYANDHPEAVREALRETTEIPPAVIEKITIPPFPDGIDVESFSDVYLPQLMKHSPPPSEPDLGEVLVPDLAAQ